MDAEHRIGDKRLEFFFKEKETHNSRLQIICHADECHFTYFRDKNQLKTHKIILLLQFK